MLFLLYYRPALISQHYDAYFNAETHNKKSISSQIVETIMQRGRFLKKHPTKDGWTTISKEKARVKVAHALQYHHRRPSLTSTHGSGSESGFVDFPPASFRNDNCDDHPSKYDIIDPTPSSTYKAVVDIVAASPLPSQAAMLDQHDLDDAFGGEEEVLGFFCDENFYDAEDFPDDLLF